MTNPPTESAMHVNLDPLEAGRYQLQEVIGTGGMATGYRAWDERLQVPRAIKVLLPHLSRNTTIRHRFETEARTMARLYHPNIVGVHDVGIDGERVYIIMELVAGGSLMDHVTAHGPMPIKMATESLLSLLHALKAAHGKGVIHRDIKPHNIMVDHQGVQKVGDFGIAHVADQNRSMTKTGSIMGTWGYMAPEQRASARDVDARADLYSAAATWYTLMTNLLPNDLFAVDLDETMFDGVPEAAQDMMRKSTRYKAEDRFADCDAMIAAVEELLANLPEDEGNYPAPGSDLDEEALGLGRRGATIVPHSGSSEVTGSGHKMSALTYAGGVISEKHSNSQPGVESGTLYVSDLPGEIEDTGQIVRKNRVFFGLGVGLALVAAVVIFARPGPVEDEGLSQEELEREELLAALYETPGEVSVESELNAQIDALAGKVAEPPEGSAVEGLPVDGPAAEGPPVDGPAAEGPPVEGLSSEDPSPVDGVEEGKTEADEETIEVVQEKKPPVRSYMGSVPVRGKGIPELETLYLLSLEDGKRYEKPFDRIPGGTYSLHYRFFGDEGGPVLQAATQLEVAEGSTPRIHCNVGFGTCQVKTHFR